MNKYKNRRVEKLHARFKQRLELQSVKRYLQANNLPTNPSFYESVDFIYNHYKHWPLIKKRGFLRTAFGIGWESMKNYLDDLTDSKD